jgi:hypothetical protein
VKAVEYSILTRDELGTDYEYVCAVFQLDPTEEGWGFLHCMTDDERRVTAVTDDVAYLEMLIAANGTSALANLEIPEGKFPYEREGWPDEWGGISRPGRNSAT